MAVVAALLAVVSVFGQLMVTEELVSVQKASDQWAYYQAKSTRRYESEIARDVLKMRGGDEQLATHYDGNIEKYAKEGEAIQDKARDLEHESERAGKKALRLHLGEIFLEIAIVFSSLAILTKRSLIWYIAMGAAATGSAVALTVLMVH